MLIANLEAQIEAKQKIIEAAEKEIDKLDAMIENLKALKFKQLEIRGLAAYDIEELQDRLEEVKNFETINI